MPKEGSIKHYRQQGEEKAPPSLPFGELAVAKDGTVYAGNSANLPVDVSAGATALAGAAMPKTGGAFVGVATAHAANTAAAALRNAEVRITSSAGALQSTGKLIFVRK